MWTRLALMLAFGWVVVQLPSRADTKRAFVVGVADYTELPDLKKTIGDAEGYAQVFETELGFEVTKLTDPTRIELLEAFDKFLRSIEPGDDIVFVFSGHGWSDGADNFLALTDAPLAASEFALKYETVSFSSGIMDELRARKPGILLAIVDACRDNPFDLGTKSVTRGLVRQDLVPGTLVVYAAGAKEQALDRLTPDDASPYSVFTRSLLPRLADPKKPLARSIDETRAEVSALAATISHQQRPAVYSDVSLDYCFAEENCSVGASTPAAEIWAALETSVSPTELSSFAERFPGTDEASLARARIAQLENDFSPIIGTWTATPINEVSLDLVVDESGYYQITWWTAGVDDPEVTPKEPFTAEQIATGNWKLSLERGRTAYMYLTLSGSLVLRTDDGDMEFERLEL